VVVKSWPRWKVIGERNRGVVLNQEEHVCFVSPTPEEGKGIGQDHM
jgi:hypothetical protein